MVVKEDEGVCLGDNALTGQLLRTYDSREPAVGQLSFLWPLWSLREAERTGLQSESFEYFQVLWTQKENRMLWSLYLARERLWSLLKTKVVAFFFNIHFC